jgi:hypothetical protein
VRTSFYALFHLASDDFSRGHVTVVEPNNTDFAEEAIVVSIFKRFSPQLVGKMSAELSAAAYGSDSDYNQSFN